MRLPLACTMALLLAVQTAAAGTPDDASAHFQRGVQFYREGDFRAALIEFRRAHEAAPNYRVLYNLGQTSLELQDYAAALAAFRAYLEQGGKDVPRERRAQVEAELKKLEGRVARVTVRSNVDGADVLVDDVIVGKTPLGAPLLVSAGRRKVAVVKAGSGQQVRTIDVAGADEATIDLDVAVPEPAPAPPPVEARPAPPPPGALPPAPSARAGGGPSAATWIGIVATGAVGAAAVVTGSLALVGKGDLDRALATAPGSASAIDEARSRTRAFALATDVLGAAAVAGAAVTIILALTTRAPARESPHARIEVGPAGLRGTF